MIKFCAVLIIALPGFLFAQTITGVSGFISGGSTITISGSSFGSKDTAAPILWDTFEYGSDGDSLSSFDNWTAYATTGGYISTTSPYSGTRAAYNRHTAGGASNPVSQGFNTSYFSFTETDTIYYTYMSRYVVTGDTYGIYKNGRSNSSPNHYNGPGEVTLSDNYAIYNNGAESITIGWVSGIESNEWRRHELYKVNSTPGASNGEVFIGVVGVDIESQDNAMTRASGYSFKNDNVILGLMYANAENDGDHRMWVDDVYVDRTQARVEIGNAATFANCTHREIQIPSAWSATEVEATLNLGTFTADSTAYLFVVDESGTASNGYEITVGETASALAISSATADGSTVSIGWNDTGATVYQLIVADQGDEIFHYAGADTAVEFPYAASDALDVRVRADGGAWVRTGISAQ